MSLKLQEEFEDELVVLLVEVGKATDLQAQRFALEREWLGGKSVWTKERPFQTGFDYIPAAVLLSSDGAVLWKGQPISAHKRIVELIEDDIKQRDAPPEGTPGAVERVWKDFGKGSWGKALVAAREAGARATGADADAIAAAADKAAAAVNARVDKAFARVELLMNAGRLIEAQELLDDLAKRLKGDDETLARHAEVLATLRSDDWKPEAEAAKALARLEQKLYDKGPDKSVHKALLALADKHAGTRVASRALALADIAVEDD